MKAIALIEKRPLSDPQCFAEVELSRPEPGPRDLLVKVEAVSVNPVDYKVRQSFESKTGLPKILGWDAAGVVTAVGANVTRFKPGDEVYYAGDITRSGSNAEVQLVDERIVGRKPPGLSFAAAAALPLTAITAWEALFERLSIDRHGLNHGQSLLIIGGAGGVGSIAIQLAKLAGLVVIATASRPETVAWCQQQGANHVIDHRQSLPGQLTALGHKEVHFIANFSNTDAYWTVMAEVIQPQGRIVSIVENSQPIEIGLLKSKSVTFTWEFMFTRAMFQTSDMEAQGELLDAVATLLATGQLRSTLTETLTPINAANLRAAHARLESGRSIGKLVLAGWR